MVRAVYYARVSTEDEMQLSALKNQVEALEEYINNQPDWVLIRGYVDEGKTATQVKGRNEYAQLVLDMYKNQFDIIVMSRIDRGWRNDRDWAKFEEDLIMSRVRLFITSTQSYYDFRDAGDWLQMGIEAKLAELFSRQQSMKMRNAFDRGKRKGHIYGNSRLWGYDYIKEKGEFIINETEKEIVIYVFRRYIEGAGFRVISKELYTAGLYNTLSADRMFPLTTLKRMIRNIKYTGTWVTNRTYFDFFEKKNYTLPEDQWIYFEGRIPAIIGMETYTKANEILQSRRKKLSVDERSACYGYYQGSYPLSGKIICQRCGKPYYHNKVGAHKQGQRAGWQCSTFKMWGPKVENGGCDNIRIPDSEIDAIVRQSISSLWEQREESTNRIMKALQVALSANEAREVNKALHRRLEKLKRQKSEMRKKLYNGVISDSEYQEDSQEIDAHMNLLSSKLRETEQIAAEFEESTTRLSHIHDILADVISRDVGIGDDAVRALIKAVKIDGYNITVVVHDGYSFTVNAEYLGRGKQKRKADNKYPSVAVAGPL